MPDFDYSIDKNEVLRYLGHRGQTVDARLDARIGEMCRRCERASSPAYVFRVFPLARGTNEVRLGGTELCLLGNDIAAHLAKAKRCAVMAVTLGLGVERELRALEAASMTDALVFNAAATVLVEAAADRCEREIISADTGGASGFRFSPGYGDFPLSQQPELLRAVDAERRLGITLTKELLMIPRKSVTAVLGLADGCGERAPRSCGVCAMKDTCTMKKEGDGRDE